MVKVIVINGIARSGKDTFVEKVREKVGDEIEVINLSTIDPVKRALIELGWDGKTKDVDTRNMLAKMKRLWIDILDGPFNYIIKTIDDIIIDKGGVPLCFFVHCREPEEIENLKVYYKQLSIDNPNCGIDCITLLISRDNLYIPKNGADDVVNDYSYDHKVDNSGSLSLLEYHAMNFLHTWFEIKFGDFQKNLKD